MDHLRTGSVLSDFSDSRSRRVNVTNRLIRRISATTALPAARRMSGYRKDRATRETRSTIAEAMAGSIEFAEKSEGQAPSKMTRAKGGYVPKR